MGASHTIQNTWIGSPINNKNATTLYTQSAHEHYTCSTLQELHQISRSLSYKLPQIPNAYLGILEMSTNALEHGNLGITYDEKTHLIDQGTWEQEILRRQTLRENKYKQVSIELIQRKNEILLIITDEGKGFDWEPYLHIVDERLHDNHGRGIALANSLVFDRIHYAYPGNKAYCQKILS